MMRILFRLLNPISLVGFLWTLLKHVMWLHVLPIVEYILISKVAPWLNHAWPSIRYRIRVAVILSLISGFIYMTLCHLFYIEEYEEAVTTSELIDPSHEVNNRSTYFVSTKDEFISAINKSVSGDTISIASGIYTDWGAIEIPSTSSGADGSPITLKAARRGGVIFDGKDVFSINMNARYWNIDGFTWILSCNSRPVMGYSILALDNAMNVNLSYNKFIGSREGSDCEDREKGHNKLPYEIGELLQESSPPVGNSESTARSIFTQDRVVVIHE